LCDANRLSSLNTPDFISTQYDCTYCRKCKYSGFSWHIIVIIIVMNILDFLIMISLVFITQHCMTY